jgi:acyl-CoA ligase (AMP-forming) (exosortase A-associated)
MFTIDRFLSQSAIKYSAKTAAIKDGRQLSYSQVERQAAILANCLKANNVKRGDRVGIFLPKSLEEIIAIYGIVKASAVFVILNPRYKKNQVSYVLKDSQMKTIITNKGLYIPAIKDCIGNSYLRSIIFCDKDKFSTKNINEKKKSQNVPGAKKEIASIIYTSGSTGMSKGVVITHKNLIDGANIVSKYLGCEHHDKVLSVLPFSFDYGLNQLLTTFRNGAAIVLHNYVFPDDVLMVIEKEKITALAGIPTIWISLLNSPSINRYNLSSLRYITNSGGKIPVEYVERMIRVFKKTKIYLMYGLTEAFRSTYLQPELIAQKPDSIGKAIPRVKISVLNNKGKECGPGEEGELVHRGALISLGYWNNKEATDKRIRRLPAGAKNAEIKEKGVFSGDIVKRDKEGFLYFVGRNDEMIKSSGYRISPTEIEEVLYRIKGINAVVVFGVEDLMLGQKIKAVIYQEAQKNTRIGILEYCKKNLPDYSVPHEIIFADKMPKTSSGKLDRSLIKSMVLSDKA